MPDIDTTSFKFPDDFAAAKALPIEDLRFLSILTCSGKPHGAWYMADSTGAFQLRRQASLIKGLPPRFDSRRVYERGNKNHIALRDANGRIRGFFDFAYADGIKHRYGIGFVEHYLTPPAAQEDAKLDLSRLLASKFAPDLIHGTPIQDGPAARVAFLGKMAARLECAQVAAYPLPDDNFQHCRGVSSLMVEFARAINEVARRRTETAPFDDILLCTVKHAFQLHDIGKVQIATHLNQMQLKHYIHPDDIQAIEDDPSIKDDIHRKKWEYFTETNYNHPVLGWFALSMYPDIAEATALHHQALVRDYSDGQRETWQKFNLIAHDLGEASEVSFFNRVARVADVTDAIINNGRKSPDKMIAELTEKTGTSNFLGIPNIDPDILRFMLQRGAIERYLENKRLSPLRVGEPESRPVIDQAYRDAKTAILAGYESKQNEIESSLLRQVRETPIVANYWRALVSANG